MALTEKVSEEEAARELSKEGGITLVEGDVALYLHCLEERGGTCPSPADGSAAKTPLPGAASASADLEPLPRHLCRELGERVDQLPAGHPARAARQALEHPLSGKLITLHDHLRGLDPDPAPGVKVEKTEEGSTVAVSTDLPELRSFADRVHGATAAGGWKSLAGHAAELSSSLPEGSPQRKRAERDRRTAAFVAAYMEAYFEQGHFVQVNLETERIQEEVETYLGREVPWLCRGDGGQRCQDLVEKVTAGILRGAAPGATQGEYVLLSVGTSGFVSRANRTYRFPGLRISVDPGGGKAVEVQKLDYTAIGNDLVAVFLEAVFDAHEGLPAVPAATGTKLPAPHEKDSLPVFNPSIGNVDAADFSSVTRISSQVEAAVGAAVDRVIQGIGPLSLNNAALEGLVTTAVSTTVHKVASKAAWCWYSCALDEQLAAEEKKIGQAARDELHAATRRVKLKLHIGRGGSGSEAGGQS